MTESSGTSEKLEIGSKLKEPPYGRLFFYWKLFLFNERHAAEAGVLAATGLDVFAAAIAEDHLGCIGIIDPLAIFHEVFDHTQYVALLSQYITLFVFRQSYEKAARWCRAALSFELISCGKLLLLTGEAL